jgi:glutathionylspermidine synthase
MAAEMGAGSLCGDPATVYAERLARSVSGPVGMVHATAYSDDRQVMTYLAGLLGARGLPAHLVSPADISWDRGTPTLILPGGRLAAGALVRFFPGEWLPNLGRRAGWERFFCGSRLPLSNPAWALLSQSKRWPLVWDSLQTPLPVWRALLPPTRDPRDVAWTRDRRWLVKPALGRVGDSIGMHGLTTEKDWRAIHRSVRWGPRHWVAQQRFESLPLESAQGWMHAVVGVYVIDGQAAGVYGRMARRALIDHLAQDVAILVPQSDRVTGAAHSGH